ncbi:hypothetical protein WS69_06160 [Burkholderia sp. BDU5]|nr:hypothetical protein WS69_06160 [Burkholderia sp. BDU5]
MSGDLGFHVLELDGWLESKRAHTVVDFDRLDDFDLYIANGEIMVSFDVLETLFNRYILAYPGARLADVKVSYYSSRQLKITGRANSFGLLPRPSVPITPVPGATGIKLESIVPIYANGVKLDGNPLYVDYQALFSPPKVVGNAVAARVGARGPGATARRRRALGAPHHCCGAPSVSYLRKRLS